MRSMKQERPVGTPIENSKIIEESGISSSVAPTSDGIHSEVLEQRLRRLWRVLQTGQGARRTIGFASRVVPGIRRVVRIIETLISFDHSVQLKRSEAREKLRVHFHALYEDRVRAASVKKAARQQSGERGAVVPTTAVAPPAGGAIYDSSHAFERKAGRDRSYPYKDASAAAVALDRCLEEADSA